MEEGRRCLTRSATRRVLHALNHGHDHVQAVTTATGVNRSTTSKVLQRLYLADYATAHWELLDGFGGRKHVYQLTAAGRRLADMIGEAP